VPDALRDQLQSALGTAYTLGRELGGGGMSRVFVAHEEALGRDVVVKVLAPALAEGVSVERFAREIRVAARLQHPNIVPVLTAGAAGALPYYTMPYVAGASLRERLERGALPVAEAAVVLRDVARALACAHEAGVVHRDVKPENVLLTGGAAVVADFGIAKALRAAGQDGAGAATLTQLGASLGTPAYKAPEQAAGERDVDARADVYAWGLLAWESLVGRQPFAGRRTAQAYVVAHLVEEPPSLAANAPHVAGALDALVMRCLAKDPDRRPADASALLIALPAGFAATSDASTHDRPLGERAPNANADAATPAPAMAVLPFVNLSSDPENEYLSDGITEELIGALGRTRVVRVVGRASSFALKGQALDPRAVGERLGVVAVLVGSVRRVGSRLRVRAELVNAGDGFQLWSEQYDREIADILAIEGDIASSIAAALRPALTALTTPGPNGRAATPSQPAPVAPVDPHAYELYLRGRYAWGQRTAPTRADAVRFLAQAVERAPTFAPAWAALADACLAAPVYAGADPAEAWPNARTAAERALALDPELAEAHTSLAYGTMLYEWDWDAADRAFRRAIAANPQYATAHHWYADFLAGRGRLTEALAAMEHARTLDPLSRLVGVELAWVHGLLGRREEALAQLDGVLRLDPNFAHAYLVRALVRAASGDHTGAIGDARRALDLGGFHAHPFAALVYATARAGNLAEATRLLGELRARSEREHVPPYALALAHTGLGDLTAAFAWLERGVAEHDELLAENFCDPLFAPVHRDARCAPILARLGIAHPPTA
jgi:serine/threonine-protein kinase